MVSVFIACAVLGAVVLVVQIVLSLFGLDGGSHADLGFHAGDASLSEGIELLSVRSLAAGSGFFGLAGLATLSLGMPPAIALVAGSIAGLAALVGTSLLMRQVMRLDSDGSLRIEDAVGLPATVYLTIPPNQSGPGKVLLALQGRTLEISAVTTSGELIPNGAPVVVVAVIDSDTVEVLPASLLQEVIDGHS
jgi:hypothetical protein